MWTGGGYPLSSDGIHNVKDSKLVGGRAASKGGRDFVNESTAVNLRWMDPSVKAHDS